MYYFWLRLVPFVRQLDLNNATVFIKWIVVAIIIKSVLSKIVCGGTSADVDVIAAQQSITLNEVFGTKCFALNLPPLSNCKMFSPNTT